MCLPPRRVNDEDDEGGRQHKLRSGRRQRTSRIQALIMPTLENVKVKDEVKEEDDDDEMTVCDRHQGH